MRRLPCWLCWSLRTDGSDCLDTGENSSIKDNNTVFDSLHGRSITRFVIRSPTVGSISGLFLILLPTNVTRFAIFFLVMSYLVLGSPRTSIPFFFLVCPTSLLSRRKDCTSGTDTCSPHRANRTFSLEVGRQTLPSHPPYPTPSTNGGLPTSQRFRSLSLKFGTLSAENPSELPELNDWLEGVDRDHLRGQRGHRFSQLSAGFELDGLTSVIDLEGITVDALVDKTGIDERTAQRLLRFAREDIGEIRANKPPHAKRGKILVLIDTLSNPTLYVRLYHEVHNTQNPNSDFQSAAWLQSKRPSTHFNLTMALNTVTH